MTFESFLFESHDGYLRCLLWDGPDLGLMILVILKGRGFGLFEGCRSVEEFTLGTLLVLSNET